MGRSDQSGKRRDKGDGSLYFVEKENRWKGSFWGEDGRRHYVSGAVGGTKREAKQKLETAIAADRRGQLVGSSSQTLEEYMQSWLEEKALEIKLGTFPTWQSYLNVHIKPDLGHWQLQKLRRQHIQEWIYAMKAKALKPSSIHQIYEMLRLALADAVHHGLLSESPCQRRITLPRIEENEMKFFDLDQARVFLTWLEQEQHPSRPLFLLAITTGMRIGELLALRWSDFNLDSQQVHVRRAVKFISGHGYVEGEPKTKGSRRVIILTEEAVKVLRAYRKKQLTEALPENLLFPGQTGSFRSHAGVEQLFTRLLIKAGLPVIRFHDLRHTAATLMLRCGASLKSVQKTLGHSNVQTTMKYLHLLPDMLEEDMRRLNENLFSRKLAQ